MGLGLVGLDGVRGGSRRTMAALLKGEGRLECATPGGVDER